jgi:hypothetical protein
MSVPWADEYRFLLENESNWDLTFNGTIVLRVQVCIQ